MQFTISNRQYLRNVLQDIDHTYKDGTVFNITYDEVRKEKTLKQLGFIFGGLIKSVISFFDSLGYRYEPYMIKDWLYKECGHEQIITLPNRDKIYNVKTLSSMTRKDAAEFIDSVITYIDTSPIFEGFVLPPELRYSWAHNTDAKHIHIRDEELDSFDKGFLIHQSQQYCIRCGRAGGMVYHLKKEDIKDYYTMPLCCECYDYINTHGESCLKQDIKSVLNGLSLEDFAKLNYKRYRNLFHRRLLY